MRKLSMISCLLFVSPAFAAGPTFDVHVHLREGEASLTKYESEVRDAGIELAGLAAMWFGGPNQALAGNPADIRTRNDGILALAARHPEVIPVATVHPYDGRAALDELARVAARGIKILKLHPHTQKFDVSDERVFTLVSKAGELDVTVLMDNAAILPGDSQKLFNLAVRASKTRFIFAHMGAFDFRFWNIIALARTADGFELANVCFDISGMAVVIADSPLEAEFIWTMRNIGIDRILFGSDYPQISLARNVEAFEKFDLTPAEKESIRSGKARERCWK